MRRRRCGSLAGRLGLTAPARAQVFDLVNLDHLNGKLCGRVVDYTQNHGADRRIYSPILGRPRDLYVYLPPGYDPSVAYPLDPVPPRGRRRRARLPRPRRPEGTRRHDEPGRDPAGHHRGPGRDVRGQEPDHLHPFALGQRPGRAIRGPRRRRGRAVPDADLLDPPRAQGARPARRLGRRLRGDGDRAQASRPLRRRRHPRRAAQHALRQLRRAATATTSTPPPTASGPSTTPT